MHHFYFPTKTAWISSGSNKITGTPETDQNFGQDEILEVKKFFYNNTFDYPTRALVQFDLTQLTSDISSGKIPQIGYYGNTNSLSSSVFLTMYEAEGNEELSTEYTLSVNAISESITWDEGTGKFGDNPIVTDGVSWKYASNKTSGTPVSWTHSSGGPSYASSSLLQASQSFSYQSPDINVNISDIVHSQINTTFPNAGLLLKFSGSQETDSTTFGQLKFFSRNTNTIYPPRLEIRWDDSEYSLPLVGGLQELDVTGYSDNYLYMKGLKESYKENDRVKFRVGSRKRYIQKSFSESVQTVTGSYIPQNSGSYAIKDIATDEYIIPFSDYTKLSCDKSSNYFIQYLDGFYPDRVYKILYKLKYNDGQEQIFDENFEFKVKRS